METAVHKMTGRTAAVFGMVDRGVLQRRGLRRSGAVRPGTVRDRADLRGAEAGQRGHRGSLEQRRADLSRRLRPDRGCPGRLIRRHRA